MENLQIKRVAQVKESATIIAGLSIITLSVFFLGNAAHFFKLTREDLGKYFDIKWVLLLHIAGGGIALLTGPLQLWDRFRAKRWKLHRVLGWVYCGAIAVSSTCAIYLSATTAYQVNWAYAFSLQVWVGVWILSSHIALMAAVRKKFVLHKEWMIRSYIATLAFVVSASLLQLPVVRRLGDFADISPSFFWLGWAVPMYLYDVLKAMRARK